MEERFLTTPSTIQELEVTESLFSVRGLNNLKQPFRHIEYVASD